MSKIAYIGEIQNRAEFIAGEGTSICETNPFSRAEYADYLLRQISKAAESRLKGAKAAFSGVNAIALQTEAEMSETEDFALSVSRFFADNFAGELIWAHSINEEKNLEDFLRNPKVDSAAPYLEAIQTAPKDFFSPKPPFSFANFKAEAPFMPSLTEPKIGSHILAITLKEDAKTIAERLNQTETRAIALSENELVCFDAPKTLTEFLISTINSETRICERAFMCETGEDINSAVRFALTALRHLHKNELYLCGCRFKFEAIVGALKHRDKFFAAIRGIDEGELNRDALNRLFNIYLAGKLCVDKERLDAPAPDINAAAPCVSKSRLWKLLPSLRIMGEAKEQRIQLRGLEILLTPGEGTSTEKISDDQLGFLLFLTRLDDSRPQETELKR